MGKDFQSGNDRPAETQYESSTDDVAASSETPDQESLLDEVLQHTLPNESEPLSPAELSALIEVARQYHGSEFAIEPMGVALVESLLKLRLPKGITHLNAEMAHDVADALFNAPEARDRLSRLWDQLCESVR